METLSTIDAIHAGVVRAEMSDGTIYDIPRDWLPQGTKEGNVVRLRVTRSGDRSELHLSMDKAATEKRRNRVRSKLDQLRERKK